MILSSPDLLAHSGPDNIVAIRAGQPIRHAQFRRDITAAATAFAHKNNVSLICDDAYLFTVGLFALLYAGATLSLPPHAQAATGDILTDPDILKALATPPGKTALLDIHRMAITFYTSGSTGAPKTIVKNLAMFAQEIAALQTQWPLTQGATLSTVSHQHLFGLTFRIMWPLLTGRPFIAETFALWEPLLAALNPQDILISSPAHLERMGGIAPQDIKSRPAHIFSAGAPLSIDACKNINALFGAPPHEIFGSTETGAFATRQRLSENTAWQTLPAMSARVEENRLQARTPHTQDHWLETGDAAQTDENTFHVTGRLDRIAKIEGKRVHLDEIERSLCALDWIEQAATLMLPGTPEQLGAVLVLTPQGKIAQSEMGLFKFGRALKSALLAHNDPAAIPRLWRYAENLPSRAMGKRSDADLRPLFEGEA